MGNRRAQETARTMVAAFDDYHARFRDLTARARVRFERREWHGAQADAAARLALYRSAVDACVATLRAAPGTAAVPSDAWGAVRNEHAALVAGRGDAELAQTFFNSVTRRYLHVVGVDPRVEYLRPGTLAARPAAEPSAAAAADTPLLDRYALDQESTATMIARVLKRVGWDAPWRDLAADATAAARVLDDASQVVWGRRAEGAEMLPAVFYRNKGAYLVGRLTCGREIIPLVLAVVHHDDGIAVDAVLPTADETSVVFGFSRSYFHVEVSRPSALVAFLSSLMPQKRIDELYTAIGYNKHGKAELFRTLDAHLRTGTPRFARAEGDEGLVMTVFTLPTLNVVFKIIKDTFGQPKRTTRRAVMEKYHLVFLRDRVGRLADAQEFEDLELPRGCFPDDLLHHLLHVAPRTVRDLGRSIVLHHLYTERRVTPLNVFLRAADDAHAANAIIDYGNAIKDLAAAGIFTGDMLLKNFGVTRHGRVIFYDYDELTLISDCRFRRIPVARDPSDELSAEPWFYVADNDVFPEEFASFLVPPGRLRDTFLAHHADLLDVDFWIAMQERQARGDLVDIFPYRQERRLHAEAGGTLLSPSQSIDGSGS